MNILMFLIRFVFCKWNKMVFFFMNWIFVCGRILFFFEIMLISYIGLKNDVNVMSKIENILVVILYLFIVEENMFIIKCW